MEMHLPSDNKLIVGIVLILGLGVVFFVSILVVGYVLGRCSKKSGNKSDDLEMRPWGNGITAAAAAAGLGGPPGQGGRSMSMLSLTSTMTVGSFAYKDVLEKERRRRQRRPSHASTASELAAQRMMMRQPAGGGSYLNRAFMGSEGDLRAGSIGGSRRYLNDAYIPEEMEGAEDEDEIKYATMDRRKALHNPVMGTQTLGRRSVFSSSSSGGFSSVPPMAPVLSQPAFEEFVRRYTRAPGADNPVVKAQLQRRMLARREQEAMYRTARREQQKLNRRSMELERAWIDQEGEVYKNEKRFWTEEESRDRKRRKYQKTLERNKTGKLN